MPQSTVDRAHDRWTRRRHKAVRSAKSYSESPGGRPRAFGFDLIKAPFTAKFGVEMHVLAPELPQLSK